ncbi:hypothetical protein C8R44DRAFT_800011, partial [Mycena epipterygia]
RLPSPANRKTVSRKDMSLPPQATPADHLQPHDTADDPRSDHEAACIRDVLHDCGDCDPTRSTRRAPSAARAARDAGVPPRPRRLRCLLAPYGYSPSNIGPRPTLGPDALSGTTRGTSRMRSTRRSSSLAPPSMHRHCDGAFLDATRSRSPSHSTPPFRCRTLCLKPAHLAHRKYDVQHQRRVQRPRQPLSSPAPYSSPLLPPRQPSALPHPRSTTPTTPHPPARRPGCTQRMDNAEVMRSPCSHPHPPSALANGARHRTVPTLTAEAGVPCFHIAPWLMQVEFGSGNSLRFSGTSTSAAQHGERPYLVGRSFSNSGRRD